MIKFINRQSGGEMWVHEDRVEEYLAAGHKLAAPPVPRVRIEDANRWSPAGIRPLETPESGGKPKKSARRGK